MLRRNELAPIRVPSLSHGRRRAFYYSCSSFYRRGPEVSPNRYEIPMRTADAAVIEALLTDLLTPDRLATAVKRLLARATAARDTPDTTAGAVERQIGEVEAALGRLTAAVASAGGDLPALVRGHQGVREPARGPDAPPGGAPTAPGDIRRGAGPASTARGG